MHGTAEIASSGNTGDTTRKEDDIAKNHYSFFWNPTPHNQYFLCCKDNVFFQDMEEGNYYCCFFMLMSLLIHYLFCAVATKECLIACMVWNGTLLVSWYEVKIVWLFIRTRIQTFYCFGETVNGGFHRLIYNHFWKQLPFRVFFL